MNDEYKPFSERYGYTQPKPVQRESVDQDLLNALWNVLSGTVYRGASLGFYHSLPDEWLLSSVSNMRLIWCEFKKNTVDDFYFATDDNVPRFGDAHKNSFAKLIRGEYFQLPDSDSFYSSEYKWFGGVDFLEFIINKGNFEILRPHPYGPGNVRAQCDRDDFVNKLNRALARENSAYRIVGGLFTEVTSKQEIEEIETALQIPFDSAKSHLEKALALFSDRENPDYENSIKESIHAVESIAKEITGKENSLNALTQELKLHPNLTNGLNELYNWTSKDGIRHGKSGKPLSVDQDTARFMLVTCSAFVNYIIARHQTT